MVCFTDFDWCSNTIDGKSYSDHLVLMWGGPAAWESRKQPVVALRTMEATMLRSQRSLFHSWSNERPSLFKIC